ncbi:MAG: Hsp70 family protein [Eubacteriales bacterium]|nr:Hsp70 family protein [Eubacteriales bacterium]
MSGRIIGIDLGTATTEAAYFEGGQVHLLKNPEGKAITPSVIGLDDSGNLVVGEQARAQYLLAPERTAIEVKRRFGTGEKISLGNLTYTPVELSALLLKYVRAYAGKELGEDISRAVISVPAYFDDRQRREVVEAGTQAGFTVERIINEPTAAALSYGLEHMEEESYVLVYDLGGGTFDVTLLEMFEGVLEVKASAGDNQLGGKDFDEALMDWLRNRFEEEHGIGLEGDIRAMARLKEEAERCKIALSSQESVTVQLPVLAQKDGVPCGLETTVTRELFESLIQKLIDRTHLPVRRVLADGGVSREELSQVILVGGSTRIPLVAKDIGKLLGTEPKRAVDPDLCVAQGAAIQAGIIANQMREGQELVVTDVCPFTLGVQVWDGERTDRMSVVIPRNTTIPVTRHEEYMTSFDNQTKAEINVYQGEAKSVLQNHFLGELTLDGIPPRRAREEKIDISFSYNMNGILEVQAAVVSTGKKVNAVINLLEKAEERVDVSQWDRAACAGDYRPVVRRAARFLEKSAKKGLEEEEREELDWLLYRLKKAILQEDTDEADEVEEEISDWLEQRR